MTNCELEQRLSKYYFYHCIRLNSEVTTKGIPELLPQQALVLRELDSLQLTGKRVLDIGCRDGLFSLRAEALGASEVVGIDNDLSLGAQEVVIPYLNSQVRLFGLNLYELKPDTFGKFDAIIFSGVLYHLRFPIWGLKLVRDVLQPEGWLLLETAIYREHEDLPLVYCPIDEESPYEPTSVTFFNIKGLTDTLSSLGIAVQRVEFLGADSRIDRAVLTCQFFPEIIHPTQRQYWEGSHGLHTTLSREERLRLVSEKSARLFRPPRLKKS
jgi:SAM-dependent methyltransferase